MDGKTIPELWDGFLLAPRLKPQSKPQAYRVGLFEMDFELDKNRQGIDAEIEAGNEMRRRAVVIAERDAGAAAEIGARAPLAVEHVPQ